MIFDKRTDWDIRDFQVKAGLTIVRPREAVRSDDNQTDNLILKGIVIN